MDAEPLGCKGQADVQLTAVYPREPMTAEIAILNRNAVAMASLNPTLISLLDPRESAKIRGENLPFRGPEPTS